MIKVENLTTSGWEAAIRGMRNPMNSWDKSDSFKDGDRFVLGANDLKLATSLISAGTEHRKFLRMIHVSMDIVAPMFWWSEFDTYKVATTRDGCSKMHKIHVKPFELDDFSHEGCDSVPYVTETLGAIINVCEQLRQDFNETQDRRFWRALIEILPEGYNMRATWDGSMETMLSVMKQRKEHKLREEWEPFRNHCFDHTPYLYEFYETCK